MKAEIEYPEMRKGEAKIEYNESNIRITFLLDGDRESFIEDGFATWVVDKYDKTSFHEWVMNVICKEFESLYDGHEMTDEEYYDVMKKKNEEFDKLVKQELSDPSIQEDMRSSVKVAKEVIGKLNSAAKVKAFQDVFGELPIAVQEEEKVFNE